jgi:hypothetical protein
MNMRNMLLSLGFIASFLVINEFILAPRAVTTRHKPDKQEQVFLYKDAPRAELLKEGVVKTIILAGDAGDSTDQIMQTVALHAAASPRTTSVYLLGDNIYPDGLYPEGSPKRADSVAKLDQQITPLLKSGARVVFVPGNHDWSVPGHKNDGMHAVIREMHYVESRLGAGSFAPRLACPGPVVVEDLPEVRIVAIDSQWFLHTKEKPQGASSPCNEKNEEEVLASLERVLLEKKTPTILVQHHPLKTHGSHMKGEGDQCSQDTGCAPYQTMTKRISAALQKAPPLLCAAGHDHSIQLFSGDPSCQYYLVTGALSYTSGVTPTDSLIHHQLGFGFTRIDILSDGTKRFESIAIDPAEPAGRSTFTTILR